MKKGCRKLARAGGLLIGLCIWSGYSRGADGIEPGFRAAEALDMLDICADLNTMGDGSPTPIPSGGWRPKFEGGGKGLGHFDNAWKLWSKDDKTYAIAVRGTVPSAPNIVQDILATSIPAEQVEIEDQGKRQLLRFRLAETAKSEAHMGFAYGAAGLLFHETKGILKQLRDLPSGSRVYVTGHSQGAAIATLVHSFLHYASHDPHDRYGLNAKVASLKSYLFAQPKPGNWQYSMDFARIAGFPGMAYVVNNTWDWVPQVPITLQFLDEPAKDLLLEALHPSAPRTTLSGIVDLKGNLTLAAINASIDLREKIASAASGKIQLTMQKAIGEFDHSYFLPGPAFGKPKSSRDASSLNYMPAGNLVAVTGPAPTGSDPMHDGWFAQHHLSVYRNLLQKLAQ